MAPDQKQEQTSQECRQETTWAYPFMAIRTQTSSWHRISLRRCNSYLARLTDKTDFSAQMVKEALSIQNAETSLSTKSRKMSSVATTNKPVLREWAQFSTAPPRKAKCTTAIWASRNDFIVPKMENPRFCHLGRTQHWIQYRNSIFQMLTREIQMMVILVSQLITQGQAT